MSRLALYRLYRPRNFSEVVGQERSIHLLQAAVRQNRLTHAYCFSGPRGTGKTSVARVLAKAVNCSARTEDGEPCLACRSCLAMDQGTHMDVIEIDAASNRGIDEIREIRERVAHLPVMGGTKVYIIDEVHMLTNDAFNALLKTLEEPPPHVMFILATTEVHKIPLTVLSRCQRYQFGRLSAETIEQQLARVLDAEGERYEQSALAIIADAADGGLRDGLSLTDQVLAMADEGLSEAAVRDFLGGLDLALLERLMVALAQPAVGPVLACVGEAWEQGRDVRQMLRDVARSLRDLMLFRTLGEQFLARYVQDFYRQLDSQLSKDIDPKSWFQALEDLTEAETQLKGGFPPRLIAEMALFKVQQSLNGLSAARRAEPIETRVVALDSARPLETKARAKEPVAAAPVVDRPEDVVVNPAEPASTAPPAMAPEDSKPSDGRFQKLLELVRQERPSTHALLQYAEVYERGPRVVIWFQFPAHRDIIASASNREVLDAAFNRVYGEEIGYDLRAGAQEKPAADPSAQSLDEPEESTVMQRLEAVFGVPIRLAGELSATKSKSPEE